ncbi:hypothetical protein [Merdimmobilis hominis]|uniref:Uncharacterized protein n=1 Tax=uncultured Anaerotruncus sp. TaxID=905011 RepID=A0A6N2R7A2_9FIRM|nr:hypothetical protein [Merdimmobilis hominis]MCD4836711.1 hypothetical protein [Merdimmobilis hominis]PWL57329.1 MAG: hypothetical protein DBY34_09035 [Oscillospiraceae bacterium]PWL59173.1 MAG: hypothetical protein DBY34_06785 [Oscillospiraceae bacterium]
MRGAVKIVVCIAFAAAIAASFFLGSYKKEQEYTESRIQRCNTLILFAIDKAEKEDLSNQETMKALISNIYAAYELCDNPIGAQQLHDLWNTMIFEGETYIGKEDMLADQLRGILNRMQAAE